MRESPPNDCPLVLWHIVEDTLDACASRSAPPNAVRTIYADGQCRKAEILQTLSFSYRAFCTQDGRLHLDRYEQDWPGGDACIKGAATGQTSTERTFSSFPATSAMHGPSHDTCIHVDGAQSSFAIFADCSQPSCQKQYPALAPSSSFTKSTKRSLFSAATTDVARLLDDLEQERPQIEQQPQPNSNLISGRRITPAPTPTRTAIRLTRPPTPLPTATLPIIIHTNNINEPTSLPTATNTTNAIRVGLHVSSMPGLMDGPVLQAWTNVTQKHITHNVPTIRSTQITNVAQQWSIEHQEERPQQQPLVISNTGVLELQFNVWLEVDDDPNDGKEKAPLNEEEDGDDMTNSHVDDQARLFAEAFDEEKERIQYVLELVRTNSNAFEGLDQIVVEGQANQSPPVVMHPTLDRRDYVLPLTFLTAALLWCLLFSGLCLFVYTIRKRRSIGANNADAETADLTTMGGSTLPAATTMTLASPA